MDEFKVEWTFRDPITTVTYPAGHREKLPAHIQLAARKAKVLVPPRRAKPKHESAEE